MTEHTWTEQVWLLEDAFRDVLADPEGDHSPEAVEAARDVILARQVVSYLQAEHPEMLAEALAAVEAALEPVGVGD